MCDLSPGERDAILAQLATLETLVDQIRSSARSISERDWIDHAGMSQLLGDLAGSATDAQGWVHRKVAAAHHG